MANDEKPQTLHLIPLQKILFCKFVYIVMGNITEGKELPLQASPAESVIDNF